MWMGARANTVFLNKLKNIKGFRPVTKHKSAELWQAARVTLVQMTPNEDLDADEQAESFDEELVYQLEQSAKWLKQQAPTLFSQLRKSGHEMDVFISYIIDRDQFELSLSSQFIAACARLNLPLLFMTND